jgi:hypothetical protein
VPAASAIAAAVFVTASLADIRQGAVDSPDAFLDLFITAVALTSAIIAPLPSIVKCGPAGRGAKRRDDEPGSMPTLLSRPAQNPCLRGGGDNGHRVELDGVSSNPHH